MQVFRSLDQAESLSGCAVVIGNLDGVHVGHRCLLEMARGWAAEHQAKVVALTFEPHPARVLRPSMAPPILTPLGRKLELLEAAGVDVAVVQPFDLGYAATPAEVFVRRDLFGRLGAAQVVVGYDFTAGHERARVERLREMLRACGVGLSVVAPVTVDSLTVSSTKVREFLLEGNVEGAALLLGRPHDVEGVVRRGAGLGRKLGFPTANLKPEGLLPALGVYAGQARVGLRTRNDGATQSRGSAPQVAVCNVGVRPTVEESGPVALEVHLLDRANGDLYDEHIRVSFVTRLRPERRFASLEALKEQIAKDVEAARESLRHEVPM